MNFGHYELLLFSFLVHNQKLKPFNGEYAGHKYTWTKMNKMKKEW